MNYYLVRKIKKFNLKMVITQEIKEKVRENLEKLYPIIFKNKSKIHDKNNPPIYSSVDFKKKSTVQLFTYPDYKFYEDVVNNLLNIAKIKENFSKEYLHGKLNKILHNLLNSKKKDLNKNIIQEIKILDKEFFKDIAQEWLIIFPLENIRITDDNYKRIEDSFLLGNTRIYCFNETTRSEIEKKLKMKFEFTKDDLMGKICVDVKTVAGDIEKVKVIGYNFLDDVISILRLFLPSLEIDAEGKLSGKISYIIVLNPKTKHIHSCSFTGRKTITNNYALNRLYYNNLFKNGLEAINNIYLKQQKNDFDIKILDSIHWFGSAVKETDDRNKFIKLTICLETLLKKKEERDEITKTISERLALLVGQNLNERKQIFSDMKRLYGIRSAIVHNGIRNVEENSLKRLIFLVQDAIIRSVYKYEENDSFSSFINNIDEIKFK